MYGTPIDYMTKKMGRRVMLGFGDAEWAYDQLFERDRRPGEIGGAIAEPTSEL